MNVLVESQPNCLTILRVELPAEQVSREWETVARQFQKNVRIPGYRPGKAPRTLVDSRFAKDIKEELTGRLLRESLNEAIREKNLRVLSVSKVGEIEFGPDKTMRFSATVVTAPEFELPDYSSIPAELTREQPGEEDIERMITQLREPHATYAPVEGRPVAMGDYAVLTYSATLDGKPLGEVLPSTPAQLQGRSNAWIYMDSSTLLPGFCEAIAGMQVGEERSFTMTLPEEPPVPELAGKKLDFTASLHSINRKTLPELDDALAENIEEGATAETLRARVRERLAKIFDMQFENARRQAALRFLLERVPCELPATIVQREMGSILREIVHENQVRGISDDEIRKHQEEIIGAAQQGAQERVRGNFLLLRVAEREKLAVSEDEVAGRIVDLATRLEIPVSKLVKDLERREGFGPLREQILTGKALDLLAANVTVREPAAGNPSIES